MPNAQATMSGACNDVQYDPDTFPIQDSTDVVRMHILITNDRMLAF